MAELLSDADATGKAKELFDEINNTFGMVPNFFRAQAAADADWAYANWTRWKAIMGKDGSLDRKTKELIATAVSLMQKCEYCAKSHEAAAKMMGASDQDILETKQVIELFVSFSNIADTLNVPLDAHIAG